MKPGHSPGTREVDRNYLDAVIRAVPAGGQAWTYTHFPKEQIPLPGALGGVPEATVNISTDNLSDALGSYVAGYPTVVVAASTADETSQTYDGIQVVRCPAEYREEVTCENCGNGRPLCARPNRRFIVKFTAHGASKRKINDRVAGGSSEAGGCYGSGGPVHLQWKRTLQQTPGLISDGDKLLGWVGGLPNGTLLRDHVLGDVGLTH